MKKGATSVRFSETQNAILKEIANACDVKDVDVARWAVDALGDYFRHHGKRLLLPLRFHETFSVVTIDPTKPLVLFEPPRAQRESVREAARGKTSTARRASGARV